MKRILNIQSVATISGFVRFVLRCQTVRMAMYSLLGLAAVSLLVAAAWWYPAHREHERTAASINEVHTAMVDSARRAEVLQQQARTMAVLALYEKKLESRVEQAELIRNIARLASKRGVRVVSQSFDTGKGRASNERLFIDLGLQGGYPALRKLLSDFAELPVWLEVVEARMEDAGVGRGQVRAQLRLMTLRAPQAKAGGHS